MPSIGELMERMLQKMARQLNAYDEASLIALWDKYAAIVERFEPTRRWEEAAVIFSLIQAVRLKNQLFNYHFAAGVDAARDNTPPGLGVAHAWLESMRNGASAAPAQNLGPEAGKGKKRCQILRFRRHKSD